MAAVLAVPIWALAALAAAALFASPQGQRATREAARQTAEALERLRKRPEPDPDRKPIPVPVPTCTDCEAEKDNDEQKCPVCKIGPNPTPGKIPDYIRDNRVPKDHETLPPLLGYKRTPTIVKQARVYERPDGTFIHRDTKRIGVAAELETYDSRGRHTGTICPNCSASRGGPVPNRSLDNYRD